MLVAGVDTLVVCDEVGVETGTDGVLLLGADTAEVEGLTDTDGEVTGLLTELLAGALDAELTSTRGRSCPRGGRLCAEAYAGPTTPMTPTVTAKAATDRFMLDLLVGVRWYPFMEPPTRRAPVVDLGSTTHFGLDFGHVWPISERAHAPSVPAGTDRGTGGDPERSRRKDSPNGSRKGSRFGQNNSPRWRRVG